MTTATKRMTTIGVGGGCMALLALTGCTAGPGASSASSGEQQVVTIYGTIVGEEMALLEQSWADWEEANGIDIQYEGSKEFEAQVAIRAQGGNAPDLAIFPQPGLLADIASRGFLEKAPDGVAANASEYWSEDWVAYGTVDGEFYGAPLMANVKGWVWYPPAVFEANGWQVPTDWQGLLDLTEQARDTLDAPPWCAGFGSDSATGWPGTDWIEGVLLRQSGPEVYDEWVEHEVTFADQSVKDAFDETGKILLNPEYVNAGFGDVASINATPFGDVANAMADGSCTLTHQSSFFDGFLEAAGAEVGPDGDIWAFLLPPFDAAASGDVVTGGGEIVGAFNANDATVQVQEYLASPEWANSRVSLGGVISANTGLDPANAQSPILQEAIGILQDPDTTFRFDASDLMPSAVGAGTFFAGMRDWVNGTPTDQVVQQIDAGWPSE